MAKPSTTALAKSKQLVADKLAPTFGKDGDFTVVVEEAPESDGGAEDPDAKGSRTEFKVWSHLLSAWSEVFDAMMTKDFLEGAKKEVIITDFSSAAVECFLRFLYAGTLDPPPEILCEVSAIADKYQVLELRDLCQVMLEDAIDVKNAWVIFQGADRFQLKWIRQKSKNKILIEAKEAFKTRPLVKQELLDEVLSSNLLCITDDQELLSLLQKWKDAPNQGNSLTGKWEDFAKSEKRKSGEHTTDLFPSLERRMCAEFPSLYSTHSWKNLFLANWVCVSFSLKEPRYLQYAFETAKGDTSLELQAGDWIEWRLPKFAAHLIAIKFTQAFTENDHLEIFCAEDCAGWHRVFSSKDHDGLIAKDAVVPCGCEGLVQRFKVQMISGQYKANFVKFECILREL